MEIEYPVNCCYFWRIVFASWALYCPFANAQLINGSFEDDEGSSLAGWTNVGSMTPLFDNDVPIGGGEWCISPPTENLPYSSGSQGVRQELPWLSNGDSIHLEAWLKSKSMGCNGGARLGLGNVNDGSSWISFLVTDTAWTLVQYFGRVYTTPGEVPYIYTESHWPCGPNYNPYAGLVDAISISVVEPTGIPNVQSDKWRVAYDASTRSVQLVSSIPMEGGIRCLNSSGHLVDVWTIGLNMHRIELQVGSMAAGLYIIQAYTARGPLAARFIIP